MTLRWHPGDLPYGCFLFWGATMLFLMLVRRSYTDAQWENGAGGIFLLFLPVIALAVVALLVGVVLTFWLRREWPLVVLSALAILAVLAVFVFPVPARLRSVLGYTAVVVTCVVCVTWVLFVRRRQLLGTSAAGGRRLGVAVLALTLISAPHVAEAQSPRQVPKVGMIAAGSANVPSRVIEAFRQGLRDGGWVEGANMTLDIRHADGRYDRMPALAAELVRLDVDVIVTAGSAATVAARNTTKTVPIVMIGAGNPVALGVVASLARPGGNVTGLAYGVGSETSSKGLELLKEAVPKANRVAVLWNAGNPSGPVVLSDLKATARSLGLQLQSLGVRGPAEFDGAFAAMARGRADALLVTSEAMFNLHHARLAELTVKTRLPSVHGFKEYVEAGSLMSYGTSVEGLFRRAAVFVDRILKGAKPAELPVEQPTQFELVINLKTAKALRLAIPQSLVLRADQVIE